MDNDVVALFFPYSERVADIPLCQSCLALVEARDKLTQKLAVGVAALSFIALSVALRVSVVWASVAGSVCSFVTFGIFWVILSLWVYQIARSVLGFLPGLAPPARFTLLGRLRFRNKPYQREFSALNVGHGAQAPQDQMPIGLLWAMALALVLSAVSDVVDIAGALTSKAGVAAWAFDMVLVLGKVLSVLLLFRFRMISAILWVVMLVADISFNPSFRIESGAEDIILAGMLLTVFTVKWWQTRRPGRAPGRKAA